MRLKMKKSTEGFTIIELLVAFGIIAMISSLTMVNLTNTKSKARDAKRLEDLTQLRNALELYYTSNHSYPSTEVSGTREWFGLTDRGNSKELSGPNAYIPGLTPTFMKYLPKDPIAATTGWSGYFYTSDGINYKLICVGTPESWPTGGIAFLDQSTPPIADAWSICSNNPDACGWSE